MTDAKKLRIVYMGTPDFAVMPLRKLVKSGYNLVGVITAPDKPAGRGLKIQESAVKRYAVEAGLPILQPEKLRAPDFLEVMRALQPDLGIVIAFRMLPQAVWDMPRLGTFNLHASLLPQYRGAAPINWAIMNGEQKTGVTTFLLNEEIDKGAIVGQREVSISETDNAGTLHDKLMVTGTELVLESVEQIASRAITPIEQQQIVSGPLKEAPKIFKETCKIAWDQSCEAIYNHIRGLSPYPTAWSEWVAGDQKTAMKVFAAHKIPAEHTFPPGTIRTDRKQTLEVACSGGYIAIDELQLAGKKRMPTADFLRGFNGIEQFHLE